MKNYSVFSKEYEMLFEKNLSTFCENIRKTNPTFINKEYSLFFPSCGTDQKNEIEFIIYGQATKEWKPKFQITTRKYSSFVPKASEYSNTWYRGETSPLDWVNKKWYEFRMYNSFFWNLTYKLINCYKNGANKIQELKEDLLYKDEWCNSLIWSNLMKIAPTSERKNPNNDECNAQWEISKKLFENEIEEVQPKFVILVTNWSWAKDFVDNEKFSIREKKRGEFIEAYGTFGKTKIIVTKRPFVGNNEKCVNEILGLL